VSTPPEPSGRGRGPARLSRGTPARIRVTSPRMTATASVRRRPTISEIDEQTRIGEVYMRSLLRTQLRLGLSVVAVLTLALGTLPLAFAVVPHIGSVRVLTLPLPWLLVGVSIYPLLYAIAIWHVRAAEKAERDFTALVESD
jgi:hypothetical protein